MIRSIVIHLVQIVLVCTDCVSVSKNGVNKCTVCVFMRADGVGIRREGVTIVQ